MKAKAKFGIGIGIILVTLSALAFMGAKESKTYYHTISELSTLSASAPRPSHGSSMRTLSRSRPIPGIRSARQLVRRRVPSSSSRRWTTRSPA